METISGYVEKIVYRNEDNGYTVMTVVEDNEEYTCVGTIQLVNEGEYIEIEGDMTTHASYGEQVNISSYAIKVPEDEIARLYRELIIVRCIIDCVKIQKLEVDVSEYKKIAQDNLKRLHDLGCTRVT